MKKVFGIGWRREEEEREKEWCFAEERGKNEVLEWVEED